MRVQSADLRFKLGIRGSNLRDLKFKFQGFEVQILGLRVGGASLREIGGTRHVEVDQLLVTLI